MLSFSPKPKDPLYHFLTIIDIKIFGIELYANPLFDQPAGNRISIVSHPCRAGRPHPDFKPAKIIQPPLRQPPLELPEEPIGALPIHPAGNGAPHATPAVQAAAYRQPVVPAGYYGQDAWRPR